MALHQDGENERRTAKIIPFPSTLGRVRQVNEGLEEYQKKERIAESRKNRLNRQVENAKIDEIANEIIAKYGSNAEIVQRKEMNWESIKRDAEASPDAVIVWLLHKRRIEAIPETYLGLAEWWQNYRKRSSDTVNPES